MKTDDGVYTRHTRLKPGELAAQATRWHGGN